MMYYNYNPYLLYLQKNNIFFYRNGGLIYKGASGLPGRIWSVIKRVRKSSKPWNAGKITNLNSKIQEIENTVGGKSETLIGMTEQKAKNTLKDKNATDKARKRANDYLEYHKYINDLENMSFEDLVKFRVYYKNQIKDLKLIDRLNNLMKDKYLKSGTKSETNTTKNSNTTESSSDTQEPVSKKKSVGKTIKRIVGTGLALGALDAASGNALSENIVEPIGGIVNKVFTGVGNIISSFGKGVLNVGLPDSTVIDQSTVNQPVLEQSDITQQSPTNSNRTSVTSQGILERLEASKHQLQRMLNANQGQ